MKTRLPNLNALRFFAAAGIVIAHVDVLLVSNGYKKSTYEFAPFGFFSLYLVVLFFVLSGFLITLLLLKDKETSGISIKKFYLSRILRIWPLYYFLLIISFLYFNNSPWFASTGTTDIEKFYDHPVLYPLLLVFIAPNIVVTFAGTFGYAAVSWSIGIEEQFYLIWPHIIKKKDYLTYTIVVIVVIYLLNHGAVDFLTTKLAYWIPKFLYFKLKDLSLLFTSWHSFKIDSMAIGALGAHLAFTKSKFINVLFSKTIQVFTYIVIIILFIAPHLVDYQFYSILFLIIILNLSLNPNSIINFKSSAFDYLGKISYGIYMYHLLTIMPVINLVHNYLKIDINFFSIILIFLISLSITIAISALSYKFFESYFLRLKTKITTS